MAIMLRFMTLCVIALTISCSAKESPRSFQIDYENDTFLMDGKPFRFISGSIHYFRIPHQYWRDRLRKIKLLGLNTITTYVEWATHEIRSGEYNFEGGADFEKFIQIAQEEGLYVLARVGPYICGERDFGGYPAWLLTENPQMVLRTSDPSYTFFVDRWYKELFKRMKPLLYGNGGPVIMLQVENEYGAYPLHDQKYATWLRDQVTNYVEDKAVLFTIDQWGKDTVTNGHIPGVLSTVDFGTTDSPMSTMFGNLRAIQPHGPLVNMEFYPGKLGYWGEPVHKLDIQPIIKTMRSLVAANASFSLYMAHGGTNFGFTSGTTFSGPKRKLSSTSYDCDAPISEAGDLTDKYMAIRKLIRELGYGFGTDEEVEKLRYSPKGDYGTVSLSPKVSLLDSPIGSANRTTYPQTMEYFGQQNGFIAYTHVLDDPPTGPSVLKVDIRDGALVLLNNDTISTLTYMINNETPLPSSMKPGTKLTLIVENQGRRNYNKFSDVTKGITGNATVNGVTLKGWDTVSYELPADDILRIESLQQTHPSTLGEVKFPMFFTSEFTLPPSHQNESATQNGTTDIPLDTFLDMRGWGKGAVWVNGHNLGRYWHIGSQLSLYVPGVWLKSYPEVNKMTVLELYYTNSNQTLKLVPKPIYEDPKVIQ